MSAPSTLDLGIHGRLCTSVSAEEAAVRTGECARVEAFDLFDPTDPSRKVDLAQFAGGDVPAGYTHPTVTIVTRNH